MNLIKVQDTVNNYLREKKIKSSVMPIIIEKALYWNGLKFGVEIG